MRPEAERYLDWLLQDLSKHMGRFAFDQGHVVAVTRVSTALAALRAVGEVSDAESTAVMARAEQVIEGHRMETHAARLHGIQPPDPAVSRFVRLVPAPDDELLVAQDVVFRVLGVELYDTTLAVQWRVIQLGSPTMGVDESLTPESFDITDDVGTRYDSAGGGWSGSTNEVIGRHRAQPAPPENASRLEVTAFGMTVVIPLSNGRRT